MALESLLTFSPRNIPRKSREFWQNRPYGGGFCHEEVEVHGATDCLCSETSGDGYVGLGGHPEDGYFGADLLQLEEEIWRIGSIRTAQVQTTSRGEPAA